MHLVLLLLFLAGRCCRKLVLTDFFRVGKSRFLFFVLKNKSFNLNQAIPSNIQPVYDYVNNCFKESVEEGIFLVGFQGGYINPPQNSLVTNFSFVS